MTFRGLTELQEQSRNAAHTSAIMHMVETNGWNQLDHSRRWVATRRIAAGDGSRQDMDRNRIWMDDRRWMTGDGSREMDDNQSPSLL